MRYNDITVGGLVLYSSHRKGTRYYRVADCSLAEVTETGVRHEYTVDTGGWTTRYEDRVTDQGVRIRVRPRDGIGAGQPWDKVVLAALLQPYAGEDKAAWDAAREAHRQWQAEQAEQATADGLLTARLAAHGVHAVVTAGRVTLSAADLDTLLALRGRQ